jgi:hypothetical protein
VFAFDGSLEAIRQKGPPDMRDGRAWWDVRGVSNGVILDASHCPEHLSLVIFAAGEQSHHALDPHAWTFDPVATAAERGAPPRPVESDLGDLVELNSGP